MNPSRCFRQDRRSGFNEEGNIRRRRHWKPITSIGFYPNRQTLLPDAGTSTASCCLLSPVASLLIPSLLSLLGSTKMTANPPTLPPFKLILGSMSVARRHILKEMGFLFDVMTADIDEKSIRRENPDELVMVLAEAKADAIISRMNVEGLIEKIEEPTLLITSDICYVGIDLEVVVHKGIIREKPSSKEEARQFLKGYSGGHVSTVGSVLVTNLKTGRRFGGLDKAEVYFHDIPDEIIENLIDEGVVFNVAGGLLLEHPYILPFVESVIGATDSVMGLAKGLTHNLIREALSVDS
ncbi:hypothetical protein ZIOFF_034096 [Zingiber officinale]|uniref:Maf-like protein n=1 Tax=Zingiber officinale TaxID=94328 RepID=A0A8J5LCP1_ZINOF|nr:hypothetical protein ZIOFF_034096 [Zingiber officinale]